MTPTTSSALPVLYSFWRSSCAWRVRTALNWKGIPHEIKTVNLWKDGGGEHLGDAFTKLNPNQRIPTLAIDGHVISQSSAILEYLEETRPEKPLLPTDAYSRAVVRNVCGLIGADIQPLQSVAVLARATAAVSNEEQAAKAKVEWAHYWIDRGFGALEQELQTTAGAFCVGDSVTLADVYLLPQVFNGTHMDVDMRKFPTIARIAAQLETIEAFRDGHPSKQADAQL